MRDLRPLTVDRVADLAGDSALCTFWQTVPHNGHVRQEEPGELVARWVRAVTADWGPPGRICYLEGRPVGNVLLAPARYVPRLAAFATAPSDPATLMLVTVRVSQDQHGKGLRKALVQAAVKDALRHRVRSIDVIGARPVAVQKHPCVLDVAFLENIGFRVVREHPFYPRLRLDLRTVVTVREEAAAVVRKALARIPGVRPVPETHPDGATRARSADQP
jgi:GNAT superfamily N-acetyltransferase